MFAVVLPPDPPAVVQPADPDQLTKGQRKRPRQRDLAGVDPDHDLLPLELNGKAYGAYRERLLTANPRCIYCGQELRPATATLDHAIPRTKGGLDSPWNLWLSCSKCNTCKGDRSLLQWLDDIVSACRVMGLIKDTDEIVVEWTEGGAA